MELIAAEHQLEQRRFGEPEVEMGPAERGQPVRRRRTGLVERVQQHGAQPVEALHGQRGEQAGAVLEMVLGGRVGQPGPTRDSPEADGARTVRDQLLPGGGEQRDAGGGPGTMVGSACLTLSAIKDGPVYRTLVRRRVLATFAAPSRGDYEPALAGTAPRFGHSFAGSHPAGGTRYTPEAMRRWFERLFRLNRSLSFTVKHVAFAGPPWDAIAVVEWRDTAVLATGADYVNDGVHVVRMRWTKVVSLR